MYSLRTSLALIMSGAAHASVVVALVSKTTTTYLPVETFAPVEVLPAPPPPKPAPKVEEPPPPEPRPETLVRSLKPTTVATPAASAKAPEPVAQSAEQPVALAGLGFSNLGLAMATGNGSGFGSVRPTVAPTPVKDPAPSPAAPKPPALTSLADLSQKPSPPALGGALARNYPPHLRASGVEGQALVRVIVGSAGEVRTTTLLSETHGGFGHACQKALQGSRWGPPIDQLGRPTATSLQYRCRFTVGL